MKPVAEYIRKPHFRKGAWIEGRKLEIYQDDDPINPRDPTWQDNFGHMVCFHGRYDLGDETYLKSEDFRGWDEIRQYLAQCEKALVILPLYLYDHSGITMSVGSSNFRAIDSMGWDWGQVGFIYCTIKDVMDCFMLKKLEEITPEIIEKAKGNLIAEVEEYDKYLIGDVYGFVLYENGEEIDSCWGFYGGIDQILEETGMKDADEID